MEKREIEKCLHRNLLQCVSVCQLEVRLCMRTIYLWVAIIAVIVACQCLSVCPLGPRSLSSDVVNFANPICLVSTADYDVW